MQACSPHPPSCPVNTHIHLEALSDITFSLAPPSCQVSTHKSPLDALSDIPEAIQHTGTSLLRMAMPGIVCTCMPFQVKCNGMG